MSLVYLALMLACLFMARRLYQKAAGSDVWLAAFILFLASYMGLIILDAQDFYIAPKLYLLLLSILFLPGPILLAYIGSISSRANVRSSDFVACLWPPLLVWCFAGLLSAGEPVTRADYQTPQYQALFNAISLMAGAYFLVYLGLAVRLLWQSRLDWERYQSQNLPSSWFRMQKLLWVILTVALLQVVSALINTAGDAASIGDLSFVALVVYFIYLALTKSRGKEPAPLIVQMPEVDAVKVEQSAPVLEQDQEQVALLSRLMEQERLFLHSDLSLGTLAERMQLSTHKCSELINRSMGLNFYEFINGYRVEYAAQALKQHVDKSITEIFYDAGFTSKSTFYSCFKKRFDCTPSEYRKRD